MKRGAVGAAGWAVLLGIAVVAALVLWPRQPDPVSVLTLKRVTSGEHVRIGYANEAPFGFLDTASGRVTGEAPEVARAILERLGAGSVEGIVADFGALIPGLLAGRFDMIAAGMYVTPKRCQQVAFSNPTYRIGEAFLVQRGNPANLHSFEDVAAGQARLGVVGGTAEHGYAKRLGVPESRIVLFDTNADALQGVASGRVEALAVTSLTADDLLAKLGDDDLERAQPFVDPTLDGETAAGYGAFAFRKEDQALRAAFNRELARYIGSPEHLAAVRPFGFGPDTLPGDVTADALCQPR
jgi:polar amino acid transport system substrate-binding protein